ncbi:MAG: hypothetical protein IJU69_01465 [Bacteroidales bacterium]|nr:hypothetical protein [Bacteroidales bacterium]
MNRTLKTILMGAGIVLAFLLLSYAYVPEVLSGKIVNQSDISGWQGMSHEMMEWNAANPDDKTAWTGSMFSGMPTITIHAPSDGDFTQKIYDFLLTGKRPATYLFISLLGGLLLMLSLGVNIWVAIGGAIAITFCSYNFQIIQVGHNTKMQALAFLPWALAAFIYTYRKAVTPAKGEGVKSWLPLTVLGAALFGLAISFQVKANHPQISYYLVIMLVLYALTVLVTLLACKQNKGKLGRFAAASCLLLVMGAAGAATNANKLVPIWEYTPYSMRGGDSQQSEKSGSKGLELDYATAWSYGWEELPNMLIPNYNGGASDGALKENSETVRLLKKAGQSNLSETAKHLPLYWGPQPFTAGPMYMGAISFFLFILGLLFFKGKEKWWALVCTLLAVLLALGNHFMGFTRFFYDYVPLYNKFRTVSMALVVLQFTLPILGFAALDKIIKSTAAPREIRDKVLWAGAASLALTIILALVQSVMGSFSGSVDAGLPEVLVDALRYDRHSLLWADTLRSLIFVAAAVGVLYWGLTIPSASQKKYVNSPDLLVKRRIFAAAMVGALVLADLFIVDKRYLNSDDFISPRSFRSQFDLREVDKMILEDTDPSYRVLDLTVNVFNDSHLSYWHKNIGGYSPAKLQIYQKYIDSHLMGEIDSLYSVLKGVQSFQDAQDRIPELEGLSRLNCRYIIVDPQREPLQNPFARGAAWFENEESDIPAVDEDFIEMTSYAPNELVYHYNSVEGGKAVFSEVYYPEGWIAYLDDGTELEIELADEVLRSINLPAGEHELVMRFEPRSYAVGRNISRASSLSLIIIALLAALGNLLAGCCGKCCCSSKKEKNASQG